jgi:hypothetical protein
MTAGKLLQSLGRLGHYNVSLLWLGREMPHFIKSPLSFGYVFSAWEKLFDLVGWGYGRFPCSE